MLQSSSDNLPEQQYALAHFHRLLQKHPFAFWGGLWAILLIVGTVATIGLFDPGPIEEEEPKSTPAPTQIQESPDQEKSPKERDWSLPLFSAVVLGCAGGSLLVTHTMKQSAQRRRFSKRPKSNAIIHQHRSLPVKKRRPPAPRTPQPAASVYTQTHIQQNIPPKTQPHIQQNIPPKTQPHIQQNIPPKTQPHIQPKTQSHIPSNTQQTQVTVLPPEDNHPLDNQPESLAEMMDLRKRQSLKSLIRGKSGF